MIDKKERHATTTEKTLFFPTPQQLLMMPPDSRTSARAALCHPYLSLSMLTEETALLLFVYMCARVCVVERGKAFRMAGGNSVCIYGTLIQDIGRKGRAEDERAPCINRQLSTSTHACCVWESTTYDVGLLSYTAACVHIHTRAQEQRRQRMEHGRQRSQRHVPCRQRTVHEQRVGTPDRA